MNYIKQLSIAATKNTEESMPVAAKNLRKVIAGDVSDDDIVDVAVSVDGSWQKRYGHNSLIGVTFVIAIETGCVLDYNIKSLFCHTCKKNENASHEWKKLHASSCEINHEGSSGAMERGGAVEMFTRSIEKHNLRYTIYVGDGCCSRGCD